MVTIPISGEIAPHRSIKKKELKKNPGIAANILK